jgi:hypothetical protein
MWSSARAAPSSLPSVATCARCTRPRCGSRCAGQLQPALSTKTDTRVGDWAAANNVELAYVPFYGSWLNRIEAQFTALRYFALDGTDHPSHREQTSMIRRYIIWRNSHATDPRLRRSSNARPPSNGRRLPDAVLEVPAPGHQRLRGHDRLFIDGGGAGSSGPVAAVRPSRAWATDAFLPWPAAHIGMSPRRSRAAWACSRVRSSATVHQQRCAAPWLTFSATPGGPAPWRADRHRNALQLSDRRERVNGQVAAPLVAN